MFHYFRKEFKKCAFSNRATGTNPFTFRLVDVFITFFGLISFCFVTYLSENVVQEFVSTTGVLIPHYDPDTKLVFLAGKGTNKLFMMEILAKAPVLSNGKIIVENACFI